MVLLERRHLSSCHRRPCAVGPDDTFARHERALTAHGLVGALCPKGWRRPAAARASSRATNQAREPPGVWESGLHELPIHRCSAETLSTLPYHLLLLRAWMAPNRTSKTTITKISAINATVRYGREGQWVTLLHIDRTADYLRVPRGGGTAVGPSRIFPSLRAKCTPFPM